MKTDRRGIGEYVGRIDSVVGGFLLENFKTRTVGNDTADVDSV